MATTIVTRSAKGAALTYAEMDTNLTNLRDTADGAEAGLAGKSDTTHAHDERYYTETEVDSALSGKADTTHNHDSDYYTETEVDTALIAKLDKAGGTLTGPIRQTYEILSAENLDLAASNYFVKAIMANTTFTFSNPPATSDAYFFCLELTGAGDYTITWPTEVKWPADTAPTLSSGFGVDLIILCTADGGLTYRATAITGYTS